MHLGTESTRRQFALLRFGISYRQVLQQGEGARTCEDSAMDGGMNRIVIV